MVTTEVSKEVQFDTAHRVPLHGSKCRNLHGHRYRVVAHVTGPVQDEGAASGMVVDFGDLKRWLTELVHDPLDHGLALQNTDPLVDSLVDACPPGQPVVLFAGPPTAEVIGAWVFDRMANAIAEGWGAAGMTLTRIDVWETPTSCASVTRR